MTLCRVNNSIKEYQLSNNNVYKILKLVGDENEAKTIYLSSNHGSVMIGDYITFDPESFKMFILFICGNTDNCTINNDESYSYIVNKHRDPSDKCHVTIAMKIFVNATNQAIDDDREELEREIEKGYKLRSIWLDNDDLYTLILVANDILAEI